MNVFEAAARVNMLVGSERDNREAELLRDMSSTDQRNYYAAQYTIWRKQAQSEALLTTALRLRVEDLTEQNENLKRDIEKMVDAAANADRPSVYLCSAQASDKAAAIYDISNTSGTAQVEAESEMEAVLGTMEFLFEIIDDQADIEFVCRQNNTATYACHLEKGGYIKIEVDTLYRV